jgi:hypothetical protein
MRTAVIKKGGGQERLTLFKGIERRLLSQRLSVLLNKRMSKTLLFRSSASAFVMSALFRRRRIFALSTVVSLFFVLSLNFCLPPSYLSSSFKQFPDMALHLLTNSNPSSRVQFLERHPCRPLPTIYAVLRLIPELIYS